MMVKSILNKKEEMRMSTPADILVRNTVRGITYTFLAVSTIGYVLGGLWFLAAVWGY